MPLIKGFSVMGVRAGEYGRQFPDRGAENVEAIWRLADEGRIRPRVHAELRWPNGGPPSTCSADRGRHRQGGDPPRPLMAAAGRVRASED